MKYITLATLTVIIASAPFCSAQQYQIVDLGEISTLFHELWRPLSINDSGQIAGCAPLTAGDFSAFVWNNNSYNYITNGIGSDWANCVNNNYLVVGAEGQGDFTHPYAWQNNLKILLPTPMPVFNNSGEALAVNDAGLIVGNVFPSTYAQQTTASLWKPGDAGYERIIIEKLKSDDFFNYAADINNNDIVVGYSGSQYSFSAFLWQQGQLPVALPSQPGDYRAVTSAINNLDQVVGFTTGLADEDQAVLWQDNLVTPLGPVGRESWAQGINDNQQIVGMYAADDGPAACLWQNDQVINLNDKLNNANGWVLWEAHDINSDGWIVGIGTFGDSATLRGFLLLPTQNNLLEATVEITPPNINLKSKAKWITCLIQLPEGYDVAEIDVASLRLAGDIESVGKYSIDEILNLLMVKFPGDAVRNVLNPGENELTLTGKLADGAEFEGSDTVTVKGVKIKKDKKKAQPKKKIKL